MMALVKGYTIGNHEVTRVQYITFKEAELRGAVDLALKINDLLSHYSDGTKLDIGTTMENHLFQLRNKLKDL